MGFWVAVHQVGGGVFVVKVTAEISRRDAKAQKEKGSIQ
jgi:hypothetical protein